MRIRTFTPIVVVALLAGVARAGDDRYSLNPNYPLRMEDAFPLDKGEAYLGLTSTYASESGHGMTTLQPEVAVGIVDGFDLHVLSAIDIGPGDRANSGDVNVNMQYLLLEQREGNWWPSLAIEGDLIAPTGRGSEGLDTGIQLLATQTLSWSPTYDAVHFNVTWNHNFKADAATERDDGYVAVVGYSRRVLPDTVVLADFVWERTFAKGESAELAEVGVIQSLGEHVQLSAGVGVGLGDDAPDYTATIGVIVTR